MCNRIPRFYVFSIVSDSGFRDLGFAAFAGHCLDSRDHVWRKRRSHKLSKAHFMVSFSPPHRIGSDGWVFHRRRRHSRECDDGESLETLAFQLISYSLILIDVFR